MDELSWLGRIPASTLRERLKKLTGRGLVDSATHHLSVLGLRGVTVMLLAPKISFVGFDYPGKRLCLYSASFP